MPNKTKTPSWNDVVEFVDPTAVAPVKDKPIKDSQVPSWDDVVEVVDPAGGTSNVGADKEARFQEWMNTDPNVVAWRKEFKEQYGEEPDIDGSGYDYRGAFEAGMTPERNETDGRYHWGSIGVDGKDLKSDDHPTRWKSEYMKKSGADPDDKNITFGDAVKEFPELEEYNPQAAPVEEKDPEFVTETLAQKNEKIETLRKDNDLAASTSMYSRNQDTAEGYVKFKEVTDKQVEATHVKYKGLFEAAQKEASDKMESFPDKEAIDRQVEAAKTKYDQGISNLEAKYSKGLTDAVDQESYDKIKKQYEAEFEKVTKDFETEFEKVNKTITDYNAELNSPEAKAKMEKLEEDYKKELTGINDSVDQYNEDLKNGVVRSEILPEPLVKSITEDAKKITGSYAQRKQQVQDLVDTVLYQNNFEDTKAATAEILRVMNPALLVDKDGDFTPYALKNQAELGKRVLADDLMDVKAKISGLRNKLGFALAKVEEERKGLVGRDKWMGADNEELLSIQKPLSEAQEQENAMVMAIQNYEKIMAIPERELDGKKSGSMVGGFASADVLANTLTLGLKEMFENVTLLRIANKARDGEELTGAEQHLFNSTMLYMNTLEKLNPDITTWYKAGEAVGKSIPWMVSMATTRAPFAVANKAVKKALSWQLKHFTAKTAVKHFATQGWKTATAEVVGGLARTPLQAGAYTEFARQRANLQPVSGAEGIRGASFDPERTLMGSVANATLYQLVENVSERSGGGLDHAFKKAVSTGARKLGLGKAVAALSKTRINTVREAVTKTTGLNNFFGEFMEEQMALAGHLLTGHSKLEDFVDWEQQLVTLLAVGTMVSGTSIMTSPFRKKGDPELKDFLNADQMKEFDRINSIEDISLKGKELSNFVIENEIEDFGYQRMVYDHAWNEQQRMTAAAAKADEAMQKQEQSQLDYLISRGVKVPDGTPTDQLGALVEKEKAKEYQEKKTPLDEAETAEDVAKVDVGDNVELQETKQARLDFIAAKEKLDEQLDTDLANAQTEEAKKQAEDKYESDLATLQSNYDNAATELQKKSIDKEVSGEKLTETKAEEAKEEVVAETEKKESEQETDTVKPETEKKVTETTYGEFTEDLGLTGTKLEGTVEGEPRTGKIGGVAVVVSRGVNPGEVVLESIKTPWWRRGKGKATAAMQKITDAADAKGLTIKLRAVPEKGADITEGALKSFYQSFGFDFSGTGLTGTRTPLTEAGKLTLKAKNIGNKIMKFLHIEGVTLPIEVVETPDQLPEGLKSDPKFIETGGKGVQAVKYGDKIYFVASELDPKDLGKKWVHEQGVHRGLEVLFPDKKVLEKVLNDVFYSVGLNEIKKVVPAIYLKEYGKSENKAKDRAKLANEYLAWLSEKIINNETLTLKERSVWKAIWDAIEKAVSALFKKMKIDLAMSEREIAELIRDSVRAVDYWAARPEVKTEAEVKPEAKDEGSAQMSVDGLYAKANTVEVFNPRDIVLKHFVNKGFITRGALEYIFGNKKGKSIEGERRARVSYISNNKGLSIDALAHSLWEENSEITPNATSTDYRDAVVDVVSSHNHPATMAYEIVQKYRPEVEGEVSAEKKAMSKVQEKLSKFLEKENLNSNWFSATDLLQLIESNKEKLSAADYTSFVDYANNEIRIEEQESAPAFSFADIQDAEQIAMKTKKGEDITAWMAMVALSDNKDFQRAVETAKTSFLRMAAEYYELPIDFNTDKYRVELQRGIRKMIAQERKNLDLSKPQFSLRDKLVGEESKDDTETKRRLRRDGREKPSDRQPSIGKGETSSTGARLVSGTEVKSKTGDEIYYLGSAHEVTNFSGDMVTIKGVGTVERSKILAPAMQDNIKQYTITFEDVHSGARFRSNPSMDEAKLQRMQGYMKDRTIVHTEEDGDVRLDWVIKSVEPISLINRAQVEEARFSISDITDIEQGGKVNLEGKAKDVSIDDISDTLLNDEVFSEARLQNVEISDNETLGTSAFVKLEITKTKNKNKPIGRIISDAVALLSKRKKSGESPVAENVNKKAQGFERSTPNATYNDSVRNNHKEKGSNLWIRNSADAINKGRVLMVQFSSNFLYGKQPFKRDKSSTYFDTLYRLVTGYDRTVDFWEVPLWMAQVAGFEANSDVYVIRNLEEAKEFFDIAGYDRILFSALDVNESHIVDILESVPKGSFHIGGYTSFDRIKAKSNAVVYDSMSQYAAKNKIKDNHEYSYRHFRGTAVIPRLKMSDGCRYKCAFCSIPKQVNSQPRDVIMRQVQSIQDLDARLVYLDDKTFGQADNYTMLAEIYQMIKEYNPDFEGFVIQTTSLDFANKNKFSADFLKKSGIKYVELGVETYNDNLLTALKKKHSHAKFTDAAMANARENGISVIPNIIVGLVATEKTADGKTKIIAQETEETYQNTLSFLYKNADIISHLNVYSLALYEGTELGDAVEVKVEADKNENIVSKSFHDNKAIHEWAMDIFSDFATNQIEGKAGVMFSIEETSKPKGKNLVPKSWKIDRDGQGNFLFYHYGEIKGDAIVPDFHEQHMYTGKTGRKNKVSYFYTRRGERETMVSGDVHVVRVPEDRVYPFNIDPLDLYDKAKAIFEKENPGKAFGAVQQIDYMHPLIKEAGFDVVVAHWSAFPFRGESIVGLPFDKELTDKERGVAGNDKLKQSVVDEVSAKVNSERGVGVANEWYKIKGDKFKGIMKSKNLMDLLSPETINQLTNAELIGLPPQFSVAFDRNDFAPKIANEIRELTVLPENVGGGVTFNLDGSVYSGEGLITTIGSQNTTQKELTPEMVADFVEENRDKIGSLIVKPGLYKFDDSDGVSIDLNVVIPKEYQDVAVEFGRLAGQEALWDMEAGENVYTGADGKNPMTFTAEEYRIISDHLGRGVMPPVFKGKTIEEPEVKEGNISIFENGEVLFENEQGVFFVGGDMVNVDEEGNIDPRGIAFAETYDKWAMSVRGTNALAAKASESYKTIAVVAYPNIKDSMDKNKLYHLALERALIDAYGKPFATKLMRQAEKEYNRKLALSKASDKDSAPVSVAHEAVKMQPGVEAGKLKKGKSKVSMISVAKQIAVPNAEEIRGTIVGVGRYKTSYIDKADPLYPGHIEFEKFYKFETPVPFKRFLDLTKGKEGFDLGKSAYLLMQRAALSMNKADNPIVPLMIRMGGGDLSVIERITEIHQDTGAQFSIGERIPANVLSDAKATFDTAKTKGKMTEADASMKAFQKIEKSDWYENLPPEEQVKAKAKFFNEISERFTSRPTEPKKIEKLPSKKPSVKITVDEMNALKDVIRRESRAAREGAAELRDVKNSIIDKIKEALKNTPVGTFTQAEATQILNKVRKATVGNIVKVSEEAIQVIEKISTKNLKKGLLNAIADALSTKTIRTTDKGVKKGDKVVYQTKAYLDKAKAMFDLAKSFITYSKVKKKDYITGKTAEERRRQELEYDMAVVQEQQYARDAFREQLDKALDDARAKQLSSDPIEVEQAIYEEIAILDMANAYDQTIDNLIEILGNIQRTIAEGREKFAEQIAESVQKRIKLLEMARESTKNEYTGKTKSEIQKERLASNWGKIRTFFEARGRKLADIFSTPVSTTYDFLLRYIESGNEKMGEGKLYKYFMTGVNGWLAARSKRLERRRALYKEIADTIKEKLDIKVVGWNLAKWGEISNKTGVFKVDENGEREALPEALSVAQGAYLYAISKMPGIKERLFLQGWDETAMGQLESYLGKDMISLVDWVVQDLFPRLHIDYNETYLAMNRTPLDKIDNFFPLLYDSYGMITRESQITIGGTDFSLPSTLPKHVKSRVHNLNEISATANFFEVMYNYIDAMEKFHNYARLTGDLNVVLADGKFQANLTYQDPGVFGQFIRAIGRAIENDVDSVNAADTAIHNLNRATAFAKIAIRTWTALKQYLSAPAYLEFAKETEIRIGNKSIYIPMLGSVKFAAAMMHNIANPVVAYMNHKFLVKNSESYRNRVSRGDIGDEEISRGFVSIQNMGTSRGSYILSKITEYTGRIGIFMNRFVDAHTISAGGMALYRQQFNIYKHTMSKEAAHLRAIADFELGFNLTQQSSEPAFLGEVQGKKGALKSIFATFKNSQFSYYRRFLEGGIDLVQGYTRTVAEHKKRYIEAGSSPEVAGIKARAAGLKYLASKNAKQDFKKIAIYGYVLPVVWQYALSGLPGLLTAWDDEDDDEMLKALRLGFLANMFIIGDITASAYDMAIRKKKFWDYQPSQLVSTINDAIKDVSAAFHEAGELNWDVWIELARQFIITRGIDFQNLDIMYEGAEKMIRDGEWTEENILRLLAAPKTIIKAVEEKKKPEDEWSSTFDEAFEDWLDVLDDE